MTLNNHHCHFNYCKLFQSYYLGKQATHRICSVVHYDAITSES